MKPWEVSFYKAERISNKLLEGSATDFVDFTNDFHNLMYILKGIWDVSPKEIKTNLSGSFYPEMVKMFREVKQHTGNDFFELNSTLVFGFIQKNGGDLTVKFDKGLTYNGKIYPKGTYFFGKEFCTLNGKLYDLDIPILRYIKFKEINENDKYEKKYLKWKKEFSKQNPFHFIYYCISFYSDIITKEIL